MPSDQAHRVPGRAQPHPGDTRSTRAPRRAIAGESRGSGMADADVLTAPLVIEYPFSRTTGPVIGAFFTALREGFIVGIKAADGRVLVPPFEYDPITSEALTEMVEVGDAGEVVSWAWVKDPL